MNYTQSNNYVLKWQLSFNPDYRFSECGKCFNVKTGNQIKKILNGRSVGFCINGKFKSLNSLRQDLILIPIEKSPF